MVNKIGYHDMSMNDTALTEYYNKVKVQILSMYESFGQNEGTVNRPLIEGLSI